MKRLKKLRTQFVLYTIRIASKGSFTNYVYERKGVGSPKILTFCQQRSLGRKYQQKGVGGQKKSQNLDNVVCERTLGTYILVHRTETNNELE